MPCHALHISESLVCADPLAAAMGYAKKGLQPIPRVASNARLEDDGGSTGQLVLGFLIKGAVLGMVVYALATYQPPSHLRNFLYGEHRWRPVICERSRFPSSSWPCIFNIMTVKAACLWQPCVHLKPCSGTLEASCRPVTDAEGLCCCCAALGMYAFLSLLMDGPASLATSLVGLRIAPHFDQPYLASSLTDFWSRRWNLTAGNALRFLVRPPDQAEEVLIF